MFQCHHCEEWRTGFLECLTEHLEDHETDPAVHDKILECTQGWLNSTQPNFENHCQQLDVGVHLIHRGLLGIDWSYRQQAHYDTTTQPCTGHQWARNLILFLWDEVYDLWSQCNDDIHHRSTPTTRPHPRS